MSYKFFVDLFDKEERMAKRFFFRLCVFFFLNISCLNSNNCPLKVRQPAKNFFNNDLIICSFGASVTAQKNSIWDNFVEILNKKTGRLHKHIKMGYGSQVLYPQSICWIDDIIQARPDICILDWFSTAYTTINNDTRKSIETLIRKLYEIKSYPIFFYHITQDTLIIKDNQIERRKFIDFIETLANEYNVSSYFEEEALQLEPELSKKNILRDFTHTTPYGSMILGELFCKYFLQIPTTSEVMKNSLPAQNDLYNISKVKVTEKDIIGEFYVDTDGYYVFGQNSFITLQVQGRFMGLSVKVGPFAPVALITIDDSKDYSYSIWDEWSYFERPTLKCLLMPVVLENINIKISDEQPKYHLSRQSFDYDKFKKLMKVKEYFVLNSSAIAL